MGNHPRIRNVKTEKLKRSKGARGRGFVKKNIYSGPRGAKREVAVIDCAKICLSKGKAAGRCLSFDRRIRQRMKFLSIESSRNGSGGASSASGVIRASI